MKIDGQGKKILGILLANLIVLALYIVATFFWYDKTLFDMFDFNTDTDRIIFYQWIALIVVNLYASIIIFPIAMKSAEFNDRFTVLTYIYEISSQAIVIVVACFMFMNPYNILIYVLFLALPIGNSAWISIYTFNENTHTL